MKYQNNRITLGITGASGAIYAVKLLQNLIDLNYHVLVILSDAARLVIKSEIEIFKNKDFDTFIQEKYANQVTILDKYDWFSPIASGSSAPKSMIICPCSMGCLSAIATGASNNLIERGADVAIKEKNRLVLVTRESPLSSIHIKNMYTLSNLGVTIMPASVAFYAKNETLDQVIDHFISRVLDALKIEHQIYKGWCYE